MDQNDVIRYIDQQFGVQPNYRLARQWNACVFASPVNGRWFALIEQPRDQSAAYLDIKCGGPTSAQLTQPHRMNPQTWRGVILDDQVSPQIVEDALTTAFKQSLAETTHQSVERLIYVPPVRQTNPYHDQPLPSMSDRTVPFAKPDPLPAPLRKMRSLYDYTLPLSWGRAKNFYVQGQCVADYTDDYQYQGHFHRYFPVYHDMSNTQLRGYFAWRTKIRHHEYVKAPTSFVYVYLYELINQIGVDSPMAGYQQLVAFQQGYGKMMDHKMTRYLHQWLQDYTVYYQLGDQEVQTQFQHQIEIDEAYWALLKPVKQKASAVTTALEEFSSYQLDHCPLHKQDPTLLAMIVKTVWCRLCDLPTENVQRNYLGWQGMETTRPFANAVFYDRASQQQFSRQIDHLCSYHYYDGRWEHHYYIPTTRRAQKIGSLLHEIDRLVRQTFHQGRALKPRPLAPNILNQIKPAIQDARHQVQLARRPKIKINLGDLDQIRADASVTRESLLTDEERAAEEEEEHHAPVQATQPTVPAESANSSENTKEAATSTTDLGLSTAEYYLLTHLLNGQDWQTYLRQRHLMVNILVDNINDKLFDEIGDTVIEFDDHNQPRIIEDYRTDLQELLS